jgi:hypothetical protein
MFGIDVTDVTTTAQAPLGACLVAPSTSAGADQDTGEHVWVYVKNEEASTAWVVGQVVARKAATGTYGGIIAPVSTPSNRILGVAQHAIAAGSYGFILRTGKGSVLAGSETIEVDKGVYVSKAVAGAGQDPVTPLVDANTAITEVHLAGPFATGLADAASTALGLCFLDCRG